MTDYITIFITTPDQPTAEIIAKSLVDKSLVACAQIDGPITSIYSWEGKVHQDQEWRLVLKTRIDRYAEIDEEVKRLHPYDVPQIVALPIVSGSLSYLNWIEDVI